MTWRRPSSSGSHTFRSFVLNWAKSVKLGKSFVFRHPSYRQIPSDDDDGGYMNWWWLYEFIMNVHDNLDNNFHHFSFLSYVFAFGPLGDLHGYGCGCDCYIVIVVVFIEKSSLYIWHKNFESSICYAKCRWKFMVTITISDDFTFERDSFLKKSLFSILVIVTKCGSIRKKMMEKIISSLPPLVRKNKFA